MPMTEMPIPPEPGIAVVLIIVHEAGHMVSLRISGGRMLGLVFDGWRVGVRTDVAALSLTQRGRSALSGLVAEGVAVVIGIALDPAHWLAWLTLWAADLLVNGVPWQHTNDGALFLRWRRARQAERLAAEKGVTMHGTPIV